MTRKIHALLLCTLLLALFAALVSGCDDSDNGDDDFGDEVPGDDDDDDEGEPPTLSPGFAYVPGGTFFMGSPEDEPTRRDNEARHEVTLTRDIEVKSTEVTQHEFAMLMGYDPSRFSIFGEDDQYPVETVSWYDALAYANELSKVHGFSPCFRLEDVICDDAVPMPEGDHCADHGGIAHARVTLRAPSVHECEGFRLPTEAEWERAARGGTDTAFYTGPITQVSCSPLDPLLDMAAWYCGNADYHTEEVTGKLPNSYGLYDVLGNVSEWTWDGYQTDIGTDATDPTGDEGAAYRVIRGGAYRFSGAAASRVAYRSAHTPGYREYIIGFRPVRTLRLSSESTMAVESGEPASDPWLGAGTKDFPDEFPIVFTRPQVGEPMDSEEVAAFTRRITAFWKDVGYFDFYRRMTIGMAAGNEGGWEDFKLYFQLSTFIKDGDVVELPSTSNSDNLMLRTGKLLNNAIALYLTTGDPDVGELVSQYCKGIAALIRGFEFTEEDPERAIMPRAIFVHNHDYVVDGRKARVTYDGSKKYDYDWNGWTYPNPVNPYYGSIWIRSMRSKDDVPHIYRIVPMLYLLVRDAPDENVAEAGELALSYLQDWSRDIVNAGYYIRTKDELGDTFVPLTDDGFVNDLASIVMYEPISKKAECNARLATALIGYEAPLGIDCQDGISWIYDTIAGNQHYFNERNIIRYFHVAGVAMALMWGENERALGMLEGLATKAELIQREEGQHRERTDYAADVASFLLVSASVGLPLTNDEANYVADWYMRSADHYDDWPYWDPWDDSVPDGQYEYSPSRYINDQEEAIRVREMAYLLEYCYSPLRNPATAPLVDCEIILDPQQWGE